MIKKPAGYDEAAAYTGEFQQLPKGKYVCVIKQVSIQESRNGNQQFVILENDRMEQIEKEVSVSFWERYDEDHTVVRFATSWATREADLEHLWEILDRIEAEREK